jgi:preprotein translocase SecE subunit
VAKTRAQRKAERRAREARAARETQRSRDADSRAQEHTQVPRSAYEAEAELAERGADIEELTEPQQATSAEAPVEEARAADGAAEATAEDLRAPAPSRADVGAPGQAPADVTAEAAEAAEAPSDRISRRARRREERERERRRKASEKRRRAPAEPQERQRGRVAGFIVSCWAELKRVQWPDRETLIQASAVTIVFIAVAAAYLGALDAVFNWLVQRLL